MDGKIAICSECNRQFRYEPLIVMNRQVFTPHVCPDCVSKSRPAQESKPVDYRFVMDICPPIYQETDPSKINQALALAVSEWHPRSKTGLGLIGTTGAGKTRALYLALRKAFDSHKSCAAITHNSFSKLAQNAFVGKERGEHLDRLDYLQNVTTLLLDDLGKPPPTERADAELEELIEVRTSHNRPILWSANGSSEWLEKRLGPDRGPALVRRLSEFSTVITI